MNTTMTTYEELKERCLPLIQRYHTDLTKYDREALEENPGVPFLHWTRDMGTHIVFLFEDDGHFPQDGKRVPFLFGTADRIQLARVPLEIARGCAKDRHYVLHFDGKRLREIDCKKAVEIADQHYRKLLRTWYPN